MTQSCIFFHTSATNHTLFSLLNAQNRTPSNYCVNTAYIIFWHSMATNHITTPTSHHTSATNHALLYLLNVPDRTPSTYYFMYKKRKKRKGRVINSKSNLFGFLLGSFFFYSLQFSEKFCCVIFIITVCHWLGKRCEFINYLKIFS